MPAPVTSVLGIRDESPSSVIPIDGMIYSNTAQDRADGHLGTPQRNKYGVWLVQTLTTEIENTLARTAEPLRQYYEPVEERRLRPAEMQHIVKRESSFEQAESRPGLATVSTTATLNQRAYAWYNLKSLPRGALVSVEVVMRGITAGGKPVPTVSVQVSRAAVESFATPKDLWSFPDAVDVNVWQWPGSARLEVPSHVIGNSYRLGGSFYLAFSANFNSCDFQTPELIVRYVREANLLSRRQLP